MKRIFTLFISLLFISLAGYAQLPATNINIAPNGNTTSLTFHWTGGGGANVGRVVVITNATGTFIPGPNQAVAGTAFPADGTASVDLDTDASDIAAVVYNGSGTSVTVTGLAASNTLLYRVYVYEYTGSTAAPTYIFTPGLNNPIGFRYFTTAVATPTFAVPAGISNVSVQAWGAGGGGGGINTTTDEDRAGGGGSAGNYIKTTVAVTPLANITMSVGAGGTSGIHADGTVGGPSQFNSTSVVIVNGGIQGLQGLSGQRTGGGGAAPANTNSPTYLGGAGAEAAPGGTTTDATLSGAGGGSPGIFGVGINSSNAGTTGLGGPAGAGGNGGGANGGAGVNGVGTHLPGNSGGFPGAGGSGAWDDNTDNEEAGGTGGDGLIIVSYNVPPPTIASATLNYGTGVFVVTLSEPVTSLNNVDATKFHINNATTVNLVTLSEAEETSFTGNTITFTLTEANRLAALAVSGTPGGAGGAVVLDVDAGAVTTSIANLVDNNNTVTETADTVAPTVLSVSSSTADGTYKVPDVIAVTVTFSEKVNVTGPPRIQLETNTVDEFANYASGTGTAVLTFNYTVQAGDGDNGVTDLTEIANTLALNTGTITDVAGAAGVGNNANLAHPGGSLGTLKDIKIDTQAPAVAAAGVSSSTSDASPKKINDVIAITIPFTETVVVNTGGGFPSIDLETGAIDRTAVYVSGSGTSTLTFQYTVLSGDVSSDLEYIGTTINLNGGTIKDNVGNNATVTLNDPSAGGTTNSLGDNKNFVVDGVVPTITAAVVQSSTNTPAKIGSTVVIRVTAGGAETGLSMGIGTTINGQAVSFAAAGGGNYDFSYVVGSGNTDWTINGGASPLVTNILLTDAAGNSSLATTALTANATLAGDAHVPTDQNTVLTTSVASLPSTSVNLSAASSEGATGEIWLAASGITTYAGLTSLTLGTDAAKAAGNLTAITTPSSSAAYKIYVVDAAKNISAESTNSVHVFTQAHDITFTPGAGALAQTSMTISWTNGGGANRVVFMRTATGAISVGGGSPVNGTNYPQVSVSPVDFTAGTDLDTDGGAQIVKSIHNGNGVTSVTVTNLNNNTPYTIEIYEYTAAGNIYLLSSATGNPATRSTATNSEPNNQSQDLVFSAVTSTSLTVKWTEGNGNNRIVIAKLGASSLVAGDLPLDGVSYTTTGANFATATSIGGAKILAIGTDAGLPGATGVNVTGLTGGQTYSFKVMDFNGTISTGSENYFTNNDTNNPKNQQAGAAAAPTTQAIDIVFTATGSTTSLNLKWTNGNSVLGGRMVVLKTTAFVVSDNPTTGDDFTASSSTPFNQDYSNIATPTVGSNGAKVVYDEPTAGTGGTAGVPITGLTAGTTYYAKVYEYNGTTGGQNYQVADGISGNPSSRSTVVSTEPTAATGITFQSVTSSSVNVKWTNGNSTTGGRILIVKSGAIAGGDLPVDGSVYTYTGLSFTGGTTIGAAKVVYSELFGGTGGSTGVTVTNLNPGTQYYFQVVEYDGIASTGQANYNVNTATGNPASRFTLVAAPPATNSTAITFNPTTSGSTLNLGWTKGATATGGRIVVASISPIGVSEYPIDGDSYTGNLDFGLATALGSGKVVYSEIAAGTGGASTITVTGLASNTPYYFQVFDFNGTAGSGSEVYLTTGGGPTNPNSTTTLLDPTATYGVTNGTLAAAEVYPSAADFTITFNQTMRMVAGNAPILTDTDIKTFVHILDNTTNAPITFTGAINLTGDLITLVLDDSNLRLFGPGFFKLTGSRDYRVEIDNNEIETLFDAVLPASNQVIVAATITEPLDTGIGAANSATTTSITLNWTDPNLNWFLENYLIVGVETGTSFPAIVDGTDPVVDTDFSDGIIMAKIPFLNSASNRTLTLNTGVKSGVRYDFQIYSYNNEALAIDYLASPLTYSVTTPVAALSTVGSGTGVSAVVPIDVDTKAEALLIADVNANFSFTVTDGGGDNAPTRISSIIINRDLTNDQTVNWLTVIGGVVFTDGSVTLNSTDNPGLVTFGSNSITISGLANALNTDIGYVGTPKTYRIKLWLNNPIAGVNIDKKHFVLTTISSSIFPQVGTTATTASSTFTSSSTITSGNSNNLVDVDATKLIFTSIPASGSTGAGVNFNLTVAATDADNNVDLDFTSQIAVTDPVNPGSGGALTFAGATPNNATQNLLAGARTWTGVQVTKGGIYQLRVAETVPTITPFQSANITFLATSNESTVSNSGFTPTTPFDYRNYQSAALINNDPGAYEAARFAIQDGGTDLSDADQIGTTLTDITFSITNPGNLRLVGLYDGTTLVSSQTPGPTVTFSGINLTANDGPTPKLFSLYVSFLTPVIDNQHFEFQVTNVATNNVGGSTFPFADGATGTGGAKSATTAPQNNVTVNSDRLVFVQQPSNTDLFVIMSPAVTVMAVDDNGSIDRDKTGASGIVNITSPSGNLVSAVTAPLTNGQGTASAIRHSTYSGSPITLTAKLGALTDGISNPFTITRSAASNIIVDGGFTEPSNITYKNYQDVNITAASTGNIAVAQFVLQDGAGDTDLAPTILNTLKLTLSNPSNIRRVAIFGPSGFISEQAAAASLTFSGLNISTVTDGGSAIFTIKVSFNNTPATVTDNQQFQFSIVAITDVTSSSSDFAATNAGGVQSSLAVDRNRIEVDATQFVFTTQPTDVLANQPFGSPVVIQAQDNNTIVDLDYVTPVNISNAGTIGMTDTPGGGNNTSATPFITNYAFAPGTGILTFDADFRYDNAGNGTLTIASNPAGISAASNPVSVTTSSQSNIIEDLSGTFTAYNPNIEYIKYQHTNVIAPGNPSNPNPATDNAIKVAQFKIQDGGGASDGDAVPTELTGLTVTITGNPAFIQRLALYDGNTKLGNDFVVGGATTSATFSFPLTPASTITDGGSKIISLFATFTSSVSDNQKVSFKITSATANLVKSTFLAADAGGALTSNPGADDNKIEVVATQIDFTTPSSTTSASLNSDFAVAVAARDANVNLDVDFVSTITVVTNASGASMQGNGIAIGTAGSGITYNTTPFVGGLFPFPGSFQFVSGINNDNVTLSITAGGISNIPVSPGPAPFTPVITLTSSFESNLTFNPTAPDPTIDYVNYQATDITNANSVVLESLTLTDGDADGDADGANTTLSSLTVSITNSSNIRQIALYDAGGTEIPGTEQTVAGAPNVTFNGLSISAVDTQGLTQGSVNFTIRATFNSTAVNVHDHDLIQLRITAAVLSGGSKFINDPASPIYNSALTVIGGVLNGDLSPVQNIEVTATSLDFVTPGSTYAGINEPVGTNPPQSIPANSYVLPPLPSTTAAVVHARDKFANLDLDYDQTLNPALSISVSGAGASNPNSFVAGVLKLDGMTYSNVGNGTLTVSDGTLNSSTPANSSSIPGQLVNVVNVSASQIALQTPINLKGGTSNVVLMGVTFTADYKTATEPSLKKFIFTFTDGQGNSQPYEYYDNTLAKDIVILKNFIVKNGAQVPLAGGLVTKGSSLGASGLTGTTKHLDQIIVDFGGSPVTLFDADKAFYLIADVDGTASITTPAIAPELFDGGYFGQDNDHIITSVGTATASLVGNKYSFASTRPPALLADLSSPFNGQLNVSKLLTQIDLVFDVQVWSLDGGANNGAELFDRTTNTKVADLFATNGDFTTQGTSTLSVNPLSFNIVFLPGQAFVADGVYYVKIKKGVFNNVTNTGEGIADEGFNFYGGISSNGILYFKISSDVPPSLIDVSSSYANESTGTFSTTFDQRGTAYYLLLQTGSTAPTRDQVVDPYNIADPYPTSANIIDYDYYDITQINAAQTVVFSPLQPLVGGATYDLWMCAENDAQPVRKLTPFNYGADFAIGTTGPTYKLVVDPSPLNYNRPDYLLCPDSYTTLSEPIIIGETNDNDFSYPFGDQDFYLLLPTGYEFDIKTTPSVYLVGSDFYQPNLQVDFENNTLFHITYYNDPGASTPSLDQIIITDLRIIGKLGASPGSIKIFSGNALLDRTTPPASIANRSQSQEPFTNSYSNDNDFTLFNEPVVVPPFFIDPNNLPVYFVPNGAVTAIPDNYIDTDSQINGGIRLVPTLSDPKDYGASTFSGNGVTDDVLTLSAVALNSPFDVTMTHTDMNGCFAKNVVQYVVYDHTAPISNLLGSAPKLGTTSTVPYGAQEPLVNSNYPTPASSLALPNKTLYPYFDHNHKAGYELLNLYANLPSNTANQIMRGSDWQGQVEKIPFELLPNFVDGKSKIGFWRNFQWDYTHILNAVSETNSAIAVDPYDGEVDPDPRSTTGFTFRKNTPNNNLYWTGGSLGKIEFTGVFQSTADLTVILPFKQEVELFVPPIPVIEFTPPSSFDATDPLNPITTAPKGTPIFCEKGTDILLAGYPAASAGTSTGTFALFDASANTTLTIPAGAFTDNGNGSAVLKPALLPNLYKDIKVVYTYKENASPSTGSSSVIIRISPNPIAKFNQASVLTAFVDNTKGLSSGKASAANAYCEGIPINFDPVASNIANTPADNIASFNWDFGDATSATKTATSTPAAPTLNNSYPAIGTYRVDLTVISDKGCSSINTDNFHNITVGSIPVVDFDLTGISTADQIVFIDKSTAAGNGANSFSTIPSNGINWNYGDGTNNALGAHPYTNPGHFVTTATVTTAIGPTSSTITAPGCTRSFDRTIIILDKKSGFYEDDFEGATTAWQYIRDSLNTNGLASTQLPSWKRGTPSSGRTVINSTPITGTSNNNVWATGLTGNYLKNERSFLYSPALDLTGFTRPMISFDANWDLKKDGVVLEYSTDNKNVADPTKVWKTIGNNTTGVNWFNDQIIGSKPGNQPSGDFGWSGFSKDTTWVESKHELSSAIGVATAQRGNVVFRFGFATQNDGGEGFAFDNFRVGERTRTILLEDFVTTNSGDATKNSLIKSEKEAIVAFTNAVGVGTNVVNLNYHIGFTGNDPFNFDNPADPSARALYYNVKDVPWAFLDGVRPAEASVDPKFSTWGQRAYDNQTLVLGQSDITTSTPVVDNTTGSIKFDVTIKAIYALPDNTILHVAMIEQSIDGSKLAQTKKDQIKTGEATFDYVLKRMLPNASGTKFPAALAKNATRTFPGFEFFTDASKLYENADDLAIIVFLQNESSKEIYQTELITVGSDPSVVTGMENAQLLEHVEVYPNPADNEIIVRLPGIAKQDMELQLVDQVGKVVNKDSIREGTSLKSINSQGLAAGIYILQIGSGKSGVVRKKVLVVHQE